MNPENKTPSVEPTADRFTPAPSFTGRKPSVRPRPQSAERLDSLKASASNAGQRLNDLRQNPSTGREGLQKSARNILDQGRVWGEKGLRSLSSGALKAADYLRAMDKSSNRADVPQHTLPAARTTADPNLDAAAKNRFTER